MTSNVDWKPFAKDRKNLPPEYFAAPGPWNHVLEPAPFDMTILEADMPARRTAFAAQVRAGMGKGHAVLHEAAVDGSVVVGGIVDAGHRAIITKD